MTQRRIHNAPAIVMAILCAVVAALVWRIDDLETLVSKLRAEIAQLKTRR